MQLLFIIAFFYIVGTAHPTLAYGPETWESELHNVFRRLISPESTASTCSPFKRQNKINFPGNDLVSGGRIVANYTACCALCKRTANCLAFSFNVPGKRCYPKTSIGTGGVNSSVTNSAYNPSKCGDFTRRNNINFPGNDLVSGGTVVANYAACCALCRRTANCVAFSYNVSGKRCYPKSSAGTGGVPDDYTVSATKIN